MGNRWLWLIGGVLLGLLGLYVYRTAVESKRTTSGVNRGDAFYRFTVSPEADNRLGTNLVELNRVAPRERTSRGITSIIDGVSKRLFGLVAT